MTQQHNTHAIVIGGSLAGLWTARVLSDHFDRVTILNAINFLRAQHRPGTPQDKHIHILLERGATIMNKLFPGIGEELHAAGASHIDLTLEARTKMRGHWMPRFASGRKSYACSRILLESMIRSRVPGCPTSCCVAVLVCKVWLHKGNESSVCAFVGGKMVRNTLNRPILWSMHPGADPNPALVGRIGLRATRRNRH